MARSFLTTAEWKERESHGTNTFQGNILVPHLLTLHWPKQVARPNSISENVCQHQKKSKYLLDNISKLS